MEHGEQESASGVFDQLADQLDVLQGQQNDGLGVSSIQTLVMYLRRGDINGARAVCWNEADKIVSYPDIRKTIQQQLFNGFEEKDIPHHFRTSSDRLYDR